MLLPRRLSKPTNLSITEKLQAVQMSADDPAQNIVFAQRMNVREVDADRRMTPSVSSLIEISRDVYTKLVTDDPNVQKAMLPEYLDYYATALLWMRITTLKLSSGDNLTIEEEKLLRILERFNFTVPEPLLVQYRMFGRIQTLTGEHLRPEFPSLPTENINGFGGYFGPLSVDTHNLYEEIPCLGVLSEAVRQTISDQQSGDYISALAVQESNLYPNENLLGYKPLGNRTSEAKKLAYDAGITCNNFPSTPAQTGINLKFLMSISGILAQIKTFENTNVNFTTMVDCGSITQVIMQRPIAVTRDYDKDGEIYSYSNFKAPDTAFGLGVVFTPNLMKEANIEQNARVWACVERTPQSWIDNRNERRLLIPPDYRREAFRALTQSGQKYRQLFIQMMVTTKR